MTGCIRSLLDRWTNSSYVYSTTRCKLLLLLFLLHTFLDFLDLDCLTDVDPDEVQLLSDSLSTRISSFLFPPRFKNASCWCPWVLVAFLPFLPVMLLLQLFYSISELLMLNSIPWSKSLLAKQQTQLRHWHTFSLITLFSWQQTHSQSLNTLHTGVAGLYKLAAACEHSSNNTVSVLHC